MQPTPLLGRARRADRRPSTTTPGVPARHREVRPRRHPHGHRRRQPPHPRRADAVRLAVAAPSGPAAQPRDVLAAPPGAVLRLLRPVHRPDEPGAAGRRGPARDPLRARDRLRRARDGARECRRGRQPLEPRPWLVDRLLRHLLTDITGNTHRAEFCIDKLYSPDSARGRLGLLELRGFEMPPHPRMALVQALLVRALVARFWDDAVHRARSCAGGTGSTTGSCCPAFAAVDLAEVVDDLRAHGIAFEHAWLEPFGEFRFPRLGEVDVGGVHLELRQAIEPWHVLGEEVSETGHRPVRRLVRRARPGRGERARRGPARRDVQRRPGAAHPDRRAGHLGRGHPVPGVGAAVRAAPDDRCPLPARRRPRRPVERAVPRRVAPTTSSTPAGGPTTGTRSTRRGRGPPGQPVRRGRAHARSGRHLHVAVAGGPVRPARRGVPLHPRPASSGHHEHMTSTARPVPGPRRPGVPG